MVSQEIEPRAPLSWRLQTKRNECSRCWSSRIPPLILKFNCGRVVHLCPPCARRFADILGERFPPETPTAEEEEPPIEHESPVVLAPPPTPEEAPPAEPDPSNAKGLVKGRVFTTRRVVSYSREVDILQGLRLAASGKRPTFARVLAAPFSARPVIITRRATPAPLPDFPPLPDPLASLEIDARGDQEEEPADGPEAPPEVKPLTQRLPLFPHRCFPNPERRCFARERWSRGVGFPPAPGPVQQLKPRLWAVLDDKIRLAYKKELTRRIGSSPAAPNVEEEGLQLEVMASPSSLATTLLRESESARAPRENSVMSFPFPRIGATCYTDAPRRCQSTTPRSRRHTSLPHDPATSEATPAGAHARQMRWRTASCVEELLQAARQRNASRAEREVASVKSLDRVLESRRVMTNRGE